MRFLKLQDNRNRKMKVLFKSHMGP